jgi:hypothetical protein
MIVYEYNSLVRRQGICCKPEKYPSTSRTLAEEKTKNITMKLFALADILSVGFISTYSDPPQLPYLSTVVSADLNHWPLQLLSIQPS